MKKINLKNVVWKEGRHYVAQTININVSSFGYTKASALRNLKEAVELYFQGEPKKNIPVVKNPQIVDMKLGNA